MGIFLGGGCIKGRSSSSRVIEVLSEGMERLEGKKEDGKLLTQVARFVPCLIRRFSKLYKFSLICCSAFPFT